MAKPTKFKITRKIAILFSGDINSFFIGIEKNVRAKNK
jgi:hypothetical protein